ncbi:unnamed protein product [Meganyctiphanes norvegica]|uniref:NADH dehydrogenase subunit 4L n=1 Tax=Meganyctiphanes norvegica TaxID=48144 RepID=A0AAV2SAK5_MEGNR
MVYQHCFSFMDFLFQHFSLSLLYVLCFSLLSIFILFSNFFLSLGILLLFLGFFLGINLMHNMRRQLKRIFIHVSVFFSLNSICHGISLISLLIVDQLTLSLWKFNCQKSVSPP